MPLLIALYWFQFYQTVTQWNLLAYALDNEHFTPGALIFHGALEVQIK